MYLLEVITEVMYLCLLKLFDKKINIMYQYTKYTLIYL